MRQAGRRAPRCTAMLACVLGGALLLPAAAEAAGRKWAVVDASGVLVRQNGAVSAARLGTGTYEVIFSSNQTRCAYVATAGQPGAGSISDPVEVTVAQRAGNANGVFVQTFNQITGTLADEPFHLVTYCGTTPLYGVIGGDGSVARSANVTAAHHLGTGAYEVLFNRNVTKCAYTATIGTTSAGAIPNPGEITVASRAGNPNGVFVATMDRSGNSTDVSFHLAVNCGARKLIAVVNSDGSKARGANVVSSAHLGTGQYEVIFNRTVSGCAYTGTIGQPGTGSVASPVTITTAARSGNPSGVFVFLHTTAGATVDEPFHLTLFC